MIEEEQKKQPTNVDYRFLKIKGWIQDHLQKPNNLIIGHHVKERQVIVNTATGPKAFDIPRKTPETMADFTGAWVKIYNACLDALEEKIQIACLSDEKNIHAEGHKFIIGTEKFMLPDDPEELEYIRTLERIINTYDGYVLEKSKSPILVKERTIEIINPEEMVEEAKTKPIEDPIVEPVEVSEIDESKFIIGQKVSDGDVLKPLDCSRLRENEEPFVLITCTNLSKDDAKFRDNADLLIEEAPSIKMGAFISGKETKVDQVEKFITKVTKLFSNYKITGPVVYEINNSFVHGHEEENDLVNQVMEVYNTIADELSQKYKVFISMDNQSYKIIQNTLKEINPNYIEKYPLLLRILPREQDEVPADVSLILMDPQYDYDQVILKTEKDIKYLN